MKEREYWKIEYHAVLESQYNNRQKNTGTRSVDSLIQKLSFLDAQVQEKKRSIEEMKCRIHRNEKKIKQLLSLFVKCTTT